MTSAATSAPGDPVDALDGLRQVFAEQRREEEALAARNAAFVAELAVGLSLQQRAFLRALRALRAQIDEEERLRATGILPYGPAGSWRPETRTASPPTQLAGVRPRTTTCDHQRGQDVRSPSDRAAFSRTLRRLQERRLVKRLTGTPGGHTSFVRLTWQGVLLTDPPVNSGGNSAQS